MKKSMHRLAIAALLVLNVAAAAATDDWRRKDVNWRLGDRRITGIYAPRNKPFPPTLQTRFAKGKGVSATADANQIDSPPVQGFTVHLAIAATDAKASNDSNYVAQSHAAVVGNFLTTNPQADFAMGVLDTGGSFHLMGYTSAERMGIIAADLLSPYRIELLGASGSTSVWLSKPLAILADGLAAIDPNTLTLNHARMVGQSNVVIGVNPKPRGNAVDLGTVIGMPLCVNFAAAVYNDRQLTIVRDGNEYTGPDARFYSLTDPNIARYANRVGLTLTPAGAVGVEYYLPYWPSLIVAESQIQGWFLMSSVDLREGAQSALDMRTFLFDTGTQLTLISSDIAIGLKLDPAAADFQVESRDITGAIIISLGFYLDALEIPTAAGRIRYTNVPVIVYDISSPAGGYFDGIIGTNLLVDFNFVVHGGGLVGQSPPFLEFQRIAPLPTDNSAAR